MTGWSIPLFRVGETEVRLHPSFFLLLAIIGIANGLSGGVEAALHGTLFICLLFACVLLHEFGHIFAARRYGIRTPHVTLWPFGGVASMERIPEKPGQEIVVALAGPAVNVVIAGLLILFLGAEPTMREVSRPDAAPGSLIAQLAAANIVLVLFNLLPAFPMDGGRVLRALLAIPLGYARSTVIAAAIGQALAVLLGLIGLFGNPMLILVAMVVFLAASSEAGFVRARDLTRGHLAADAMITAFEGLPVSATADDAAQLLLRTTQQEFPVIDGAARLRGMVTRDAIIAALSRTGGGTPVLEVMIDAIATVAPNACLDTVFQTLQANGQPAVAVADERGRLMGYITRENIAELVMIRTSSPGFQRGPTHS